MAYLDLSSQGMSNTRLERAELRYFYLALKCDRRFVGWVDNRNTEISY